MKHYRPLKGIDWVVVLLWTVIMCFILYFLSGCSAVKRAQKVDVIWHDGECLLVAEGVSAAQAKTMVESWQFRECDIKISGTEKSNGTKPVLPKE